MFAKRFPDDARAGDIKRASSKGRAFLKSIQRTDGSWYGSWAVCFTYGTWFGVKGLVATGSTYETCPALRKAVAFLLSKQMPDGGWGESYLSCQNKKYVQLTDDKRTGAGAPVDHIVNTAWALLALVAAGQAERDPAPLHAAARALMRRQRENGDFPQQTIMGVFNNNCMITYANYRNIFPIWALGEYAKAVHGPGVSPRVEDAAAAKSAAGAPPAARGAAKPAAGKPPKAPAAPAGLICIEFPVNSRTWQVLQKHFARHPKTDTPYEDSANGQVEIRKKSLPVPSTPGPRRLPAHCETARTRRRVCHSDARSASPRTHESRTSESRGETLAGSSRGFQRPPHLENTPH